MFFFKEKNTDKFYIQHIPQVTSCSFNRYTEFMVSGVLLCVKKALK